MTDKDLYWKNNQTPASRRHGDIYFSPENGLQESRHVFLQGIHAPEIWHNEDHFTLLENGFGTGLNFVMTCHEWLKTAPVDARMTYIATEKYPLTKKDIDRALSCWPELVEEKQELLAKYPPQVQGFHQRELAGGRIKLLLLIGDSADCLSRLEASVDAFYLDGFAPRNNPDMWSGNIFSEIARLAAPGARLTTFTAAGFVRRGLEAVGFQMYKSEGFGKKRESLRGEFAGSAAPGLPPWYHRPPALAKGSSIAIIGGGIAGLTAGMALQKSGYQVTIFERDHQPMNQASSNPAGILDPYITVGDSPEGAFYRAALFHALDYVLSLDPAILLHQGLTKFATSPAEKQKFARLLDQAQLPAEVMCAGPDGALHFPNCGAMAPPKIRQNLSRKLNIRNKTNISRIEHDEQWTLYHGETIRHKADAVVICGGPATVHFPETEPLPLDPVRGQITLLDAGKFAAPPQQVMCGKAYFIPPFDLDGRMTMITGATFSRNDTDTALRAEDHAENLKNLAALWPGISQELLEDAVIGGRCAIRAYSPDHMPICGPVPDFAAYQTAYEMLKHGPRHQEFKPAPYQPNLYVMSGLGARGFLAAPLLADTLAAQVSGAPLPVPRNIYESLHPARFMIRKLAKGK